MIMFGEVDDVRNITDSLQVNLNADEDFTAGVEMAEVQSVDAAAADGECDSKPTALSTRASAFSIAALMKDRDKDGTTPLSGSRRTDGRQASALFDAATDKWQRRQSREQSDAEEAAKSNSDAEIWTAFAVAGQRRT